MKLYTRYDGTVEAPLGSVRSDYLRLRCESAQHGYPARIDLRTAKILARWREQEDAELVRLRYVPDDDVDMSWLDQSADDMAQGNERAWKAIGKAERERASADGAWVLVGEYRTSEDEPWEHADSCGGFIGDDGLDAGGYAADIMATTLKALEDASEDTCCACGRPRIEAQ